MILERRGYKLRQNNQRFEKHAFKMFCFAAKREQFNYSNRQRYIRASCNVPRLVYLPLESVEFDWLSAIKHPKLQQLSVTVGLPYGLNKAPVDTLWLKSALRLGKLVRIVQRVAG